MNFSLQNPPKPAASPAPTRDLPQVDRPGLPQRRRGLARRAPLMAGVVIAGTAGLMLVAGGNSMFGKSISGYFTSRKTEVLRYPVQRMPLSITVVSRGNLESAKSLDVQSEVEGTPQIIELLPEGTEVKKG